MAEASGIREALDKMVKHYSSMIESFRIPNSLRATLHKRLLDAREKMLRRLRSGELTSEFPGIFAEFARQLLAAINLYEPSPEQLEWLAFVEDLTQRQGTHMPDWSAFYAKRAELERKIEERDDG